MRGFCLVVSLSIAFSAVTWAKQCGDPQYSCPDDSTCCLLADGEYGCCPMPSAVCCEDHIHCCPAGGTCDVEEGICNNANGKRTLMQKKFKAHKSRTEMKDVICPDSRSRCPSGTTCCSMPTGQYGCCPMPDAVCCDDHTHCCPNGYHCDVSAGSCALQGTSLTTPWRRKFSSTPIEKTPTQHQRKTLDSDEDDDLDAADEICPDSRSRCPSGTTCCQLPTGQYGCCPAPHAVCCEDHMHCCPDGFRCTVEGSRCVQQGTSFSVRSMRKFPSTPHVVKDAIDYREPKEIVSLSDKRKHPVPCGEGYGCGRRQTCCAQYDDEEGPYAESACCPLGEASCCRHGCCPAGYACGSDGRSCEKRAKKIVQFLH